VFIQCCKSAGAKYVITTACYMYQKWPLVIIRTYMRNIKHMCASIMLESFLYLILQNISHTNSL